MAAGRRTRTSRARRSVPAIVISAICWCGVILYPGKVETYGRDSTRRDALIAGTAGLIAGTLNPLRDAHAQHAAGAAQSSVDLSRFNTLADLPFEKIGRRRRRQKCSKTSFSFSVQRRLTCGPCR